MSRWGGSELGLSAQSIAYSNGANHPHDPSDLLRCVNYCTGQGISTAKLQQRMAGKSVAWDRLLPAWDELTGLLRHEMETRTDGMGPRTYRAMKRVLAGRPKCAGCDGTGEGGPCPKCRGTGRRSGGRCRAAGCHFGALPCTVCAGEGFLR